MVAGLKHQKEKRSMDHFAGSDVSVKETSVCIVNETGKTVREVKLASELDALVAMLTSQSHHEYRSSNAQSSGSHLRFAPDTKSAAVE